MAEIGYDLGMDEVNTLGLVVSFFNGAFRTAGMKAGISANDGFESLSSVRIGLRVRF